jgi:hexosaminidase
MRHTTLLVSLLLGFIAIGAQASVEPAIIPAPVSINVGDDVFELQPGFTVSHSEGAGEVAVYLAEVLTPAMGKAPVSGPAGAVHLELVTAPLSHQGSELGSDGYQLQVDGNGVHIEASSTTGLFYGVQTLRQLLPSEAFASKAQSVQWAIPHVQVVDEPRFGWRGLHLDVGRHFMPVEFIKKYIDLLALHKMNRFHWHLTEDQGWRIEIRKYPKLTEVGACRDETMIGHYWDRPWWAWLTFWKEAPHQYDGQRYCGHYTQHEVREIVAYAASRHVTVVPEIELPGHAQAAVVAYPELASSDEKIGVKREWGISHHIYNPEDSTIEFLKDVLTEVLELFPGEYIHIGGDEAHKDLWENNPRVAELMRERGLANVDEMQSWFIKQFDVFLAENGRRLIGWDEILEGGLAPGATVMSWRGAEGGIAAATAGHDVVMADNRYTYFDYYQSKPKKDEPLAIGGYLPLEKVYHYDPIPSELNEQQAKHILGAQGQLWTEYMKTPEHVEYMAFPRAAALAEVVWRYQPAEQRDFERFLKRLQIHNRRLDQLEVNYRPQH